MNLQDFNTPAKRLQLLEKFQGIWSWVWLGGLGALGVYAAVVIFPYIISGLDNAASLLQSLLWLGLWVVVFAAYLFVVTHKGLRMFLLRLFDHIIYSLNRALTRHDPFTDAQISIDRLKVRAQEVQTGWTNVEGAKKKVAAKISEFEKKRDTSLTSAEVARERHNDAQVASFARRAAKYESAIGRLQPQVELTTRISTRLGDFHAFMVAQAEEQQENLNLELDTYGVLKETKEATQAAYAFLDGDERARLNESLGYIATTNAVLAADADIFIRNTQVVVDTFKFEDEVKTAKAVEAFDKWLADKQGKLQDPRALSTGQSAPISARDSMGKTSSRTADPYGLLKKK